MGLVVIAAAVWAFFALTNQDGSSKRSNLSNEVTADARETTNTAVAPEFDFSEIRNKETRFARRLAIYNLVDEADETTLEQLFDQSTQMPAGFFRREFERAIVRKWATISPPNILKHLEGIVIFRYRDLLPIVFEEWARSDLDEALSYASQFGPASRQIVFESIRDSLEENDVSVLMEIAQNLQIEYYATQRIFNELANSEIGDPSSSWARFIDEHRNRLSLYNHYRRHYAIEIAKALVEEKGVDALYEVSASLSNVNDRMTVLPTIVPQVAKHDPQAALEFALTEERDLRGMTRGVVYVWVDSDPKAALAAVSAIEDVDRRVRLQRNVFDRWSVKDPVSLLQELSNLPEESRQLAEKTVQVALRNHSPEQKVKWLKEIEHPDIRANVASQIAVSLAKQDVSVALSWIDSESSLDSIKARLIHDIVREIAPTDPQLALDTALEYSVPVDSVGPEAEIIGVIARYDLDAAIKMLPVARNEATKLAGLLSIGSHLVGRTHDSHDRAIELADELSSDEDKNRYLSLLMFDFEYEDLYSMIDQFPTSELREQAANLLLDNDKQNLSATQIEKLQAYQTKSK